MLDLWTDRPTQITIIIERCMDGFGRIQRLFTFAILDEPLLLNCDFSKKLVVVAKQK